MGERKICKFMINGNSKSSTYWAGLLDSFAEIQFMFNSGNDGVSDA